MAVNHTSNVTGTTCNLEEIGKVCKDNNLLFLVDAAQSAGHLKIDMEKCNINLLALAGHKGLYAPQGIGALLVNWVKLKPIKFGGTGTNSRLQTQPDIIPDGFEAGTQSVPLIMAFNKGIKYAYKHTNKQKQKIKGLSQYLIKELIKTKNITLYTNHKSCCGVISFNLKNISSADLSNYLNITHKICVRAGFHCAPLVHKHFNTLNNGMLRVSIGYKNKKADIKKLLSALKQVDYLLTK